MNSNLPSEKDLEALALIRQGERHIRAAHKLDIAVPTLKLRLQNCRDKLGAQTTAQAVAEAIIKGLIK